MTQTRRRIQAREGRSSRRGRLALGAGLGAAGLLAAAMPSGVRAADYGDSASTVADPAADLADVYGFRSGDKAVIALTYAANRPPAAGELYDREMVYRFHIAGDANHEIDVRFGKNASGAWGVRVDNVPGATGSIVGCTGAVIEQDGVKVFAGLRDDPFFADLEGLEDTVATGTFAFNPARDARAGLNAMAIVIELPLASLVSAGNDFTVWARSLRYVTGG